MNSFFLEGAVRCYFISNTHDLFSLYRCCYVLGIQLINTLYYSSFIQESHTSEDLSLKHFVLEVWIWRSLCPTCAIFGITPSNIYVDFSLLEVTQRSILELN